MNQSLRNVGPRTLAAVAVAAIIFAWAPRGAAAQTLERSFDAHIFEPAIGPRQLMSVENARVAGHLKWGVGGFFGYMNRPLSVYVVDTQNDLEERYPLIGNHAAFYFYGFFGFLKRFQVSLGLPVYYQTQHDRYQALFNDINVAQPAGVEGGAAGDLRIHFKAFIHSVNKEMFNIAASIMFTVPIMHLASPEKDRFTGDKSATIWPRMIFDVRWQKLIVAANLGFLARVAKSQYLSSKVSHALTFSTGLGYQVASFGDWNFDVMGELVGRNGLTTEIDETPLEVDLAVRLRSWNGLAFLVGGGAGLIKAIGSPKFRIFLSVQYSPDFADKDKDGVADFRDKCPNQKEDKDGFQDDDGCPDTDNDQDGISDKDDKCPNRKEDKDGFQDNDGCPDLDNDGDGVPDNRDNCPIAKGPIKTKGCPENMLDDDGDKIPNSKDKCPNEAEDKDGFEDTDGCPEADNDKDGIPDEHDKCKNDPEDKDGHADGDGCPDPDNDADGVCDDNPVIQKNLSKYRAICIGADKCEGKRETINGYKDSDGCPDRGREVISFNRKATASYKGRFIPRKRFTFKTKYGAELTAQNKVVLLTLAHMLRAIPIFKKVAIVAHTDMKQSPGKAVSITQAQADVIHKFLLAQGIAPGRLAKVPAGNKLLACKRRRRSRRCQRKNRRVEFYILQMGN